MQHCTILLPNTQGQPQPQVYSDMSKASELSPQL